tara:strand:+ start:7784 stop:8020 length:237 start_codon:yes stop_codon:yes gene_type:complete
MKKLLTVLLTLVVLSLFSFSPSQKDDFNIRESINILEDMKEWMLYDIEINDIDKEKGLLYIENIDIVTKKLNTLNQIK